jgi:hypothetical protein
MIDQDDDYPYPIVYPGKYQSLNPNNEPTGHYTGRCHKCGSKDLWDDNLAYGCNSCGAFLGN